jgi:small multidrug resistance family-3 protein
MSNDQKESTDTNNTATAPTNFRWDALSILQSLVIFVLAGFAEIIGGWLIWVAVKGIRVEEEVLDVPPENDNNSTTNDGNDNEDYLPSVSPTSSQTKYIITKKPWYYAVLGSITLIAYGFLPTLQPSAASDGFARIYAAYGGFFIVLSYLLGWALEGESAKPDVGDLVGGGIALVGVGVLMFWPRG